MYMVISDTFKNKILFCPPLLILFTGGTWAVWPIKKWKIKCRIKTNRSSLLILNVSVLNAAFEDMYEDMSFQQIGILSLFWKPFLSFRAKMAGQNQRSEELQSHFSSGHHTWDEGCRKAFLSGTLMSGIREGKLHKPQFCCGQKGFMRSRSQITRVLF